MDALSIAAVIGLVAVAMGKKGPSGDGSGNVDGSAPVTGLPPPDPGPGGAVEGHDEMGNPVLSTNDGAGQVVEEQTGGTTQHPSKPGTGASCACIRAPCACQGGKGEGVRTLPDKPTGTSPDKAPSGPGGGYDGSGINPPAPSRPTTPAKPGSSGGTKPTTSGQTKPTGKTTQGPPIMTSPKIYTSLSKSTPKDAARALESHGPAVGAVW